MLVFQASSSNFRFSNIRMSNCLYIMCRIYSICPPSSLQLILHLTFYEMFFHITLETQVSCYLRLPFETSDLTNVLTQIEKMNSVVSFVELIYTIANICSEFSPISLPFFSLFVIICYMTSQHKRTFCNSLF